jgi:hypothetical protein
MFDDTGGASNDANNTLKRDNLNVHLIRLVAGRITNRRNGSDGFEIPPIVAKTVRTQVAAGNKTPRTTTTGSR